MAMRHRMAVFAAAIGSSVLALMVVGAPLFGRR